MTTKTSTFSKWLNTLIDEKGIDLEQTFEFDFNGEYNLMPYGVVVEAIHNAPRHEQEAIKTMLVKIDFVNGDVRHYFRHLAVALAANRAEVC